MAAGIFNAVNEYAVDQGADWYLNFQYLDSNDDPIDLAGYTARLQIRSLPTTLIPALTLTTGNGITVDVLTATFEVHATADQTRSISAGFYYYDLEITAPVSGIITRLVQGKIEINPEVTR